MARSAHRKILDGAAIERVIARLAQEILERSPDAKNPVLIGIRTRGVPLAQRIAQRIMATDKIEVPVGILDITLYRDDLQTVGPAPVVGATELPLDLTDRTVVIVDDVLYTGRTIRAVLNELFDYGRPASVKLATKPNANSDAKGWVLYGSITSLRTK